MEAVRSTYRAHPVAVGSKWTIVQRRRVIVQPIDVAHELVVIVTGDPVGKSVVGADDECVDIASSRRLVDRAELDGLVRDAMQCRTQRFVHFPPELPPAPWSSPRVASAGED